MDVAQLAESIVAALAPFLPVLFSKAADAAAEATVEKLGEAAWKRAKALWDKLRPGVEARPELKRAAETVADAPTDAAARDALARKIAEMLAQDLNVTSELARVLLAEAKGDRSIAVAGSVADSAFITGDFVQMTIVVGDGRMLLGAPPKTPEPAECELPRLPSGGYVFLSYAREDRDAVEVLAQQLAAVGVTVWYDRELKAGERWVRELEMRIQAARALVVVISPRSKDSKWVQREVLYAENHGVPVIPYLLEWTDFPIWAVNLQVVRTVDAVVQALAGPVPGTPGPLLAPNPFCDRGRIKDPARFFDRFQILRELRQMLSVGNSVSVVGEPEIGKSSLLYQLYLARSEWLPDGHVVFVDLQGTWNVNDFCAEILEALGAEGRDVLALKKALRKSRVVLILDEVEKLNDRRFPPELQDLLRALAQEPTLTLAVASHRPLEEVLPARGKTSPFHNVFTEMRLPPFADEVAAAFLRSRLAETGVQFTDAEVQRLVSESGGHPARLQRLAYRLFEAKRG